MSVELNVESRKNEKSAEINSNISSDVNCEAKYRERGMYREDEYECDGVKGGGRKENKTIYERNERDRERERGSVVMRT